MLVAFANARLAYSRLSLTLYATGSFIGFRSATVEPAYLDRPCEARGAADALLPREVGERHTRLALYQEADDPTFREPGFRIATPFKVP